MIFCENCGSETEESSILCSVCAMGSHTFFPRIIQKDADHYTETLRN